VRLIEGGVDLVERAIRLEAGRGAGLHSVVTMPPSTGITAPVTYALAGDARSIATPAMSSGRPIRPRGHAFMHKFRKLGFIEYNGDLKVHSSLLSVVLHD